MRGHMMWMPCSGRNSVEGLSWLPRLLEKARRSEASTSGRLVDGYCYGDNDFIDKQLLTFLRTTDTAVSALVRQNPDDADVARVLVERSGRTRAECEAFDKAFRRKNLNFIFVEADEGRLGSGVGPTIVKALYNGAIMPIFYSLFRRDERKRLRRSRSRL